MHLSRPATGWSISRHPAFTLAKPKCKYSPEFKVQVFMEALSGFKGGSEVCRECGSRSQPLSKWKAQFQENAVGVFAEQRQAPAEDSSNHAYTGIGHKVTLVELTKSIKY